jgi:murein DD-endopeptidase MepM/ murein hydrolase activator NlpD
MNCKILQKGKCEITQYYSENHKAIDLVGEEYSLDNIISHDSGTIVEIQDGMENMKGSIGLTSYGNYIKIKHNNEYETLYAHMKKDLNHKRGDYIQKGEIIGYMSDSGNAYGKHLHFEVWKNNQRINPIEFLNKDFPVQNNESMPITYNVGDVVEINGVYVSSDSIEKLRPLVTKGKITKIIKNANNPFLLEDGRIGWINNSVIVNKTRYLSNKQYKGTSIVDALKEINVDSSYQNRTKLAKINNIDSYKGTADQNNKMLSLLKQGILKY